MVEDVMLSTLEKHFEWYLEELKKAGYVKEYNSKPESRTLFNKASYTYTKQLVTKTKQVSAGIPGLPKMIYTPDFKIEWTERAMSLFWQDIYGGNKITSPFPINFLCAAPVSFVEIKPDFDNQNMTRVVMPKILRMWESYRRYIQIITPEKIFAKTFTPQRYLFCDVLENKKRKINYPIHTLKEYIAEK